MTPISATRVIATLTDIAGAGGLIAIIINVPFQFCRQGSCFACQAGFLFSPPIWGSGALCAIHWEQLLLRLIAVGIAWALARYALARLSR